MQEIWKMKWIFHIRGDIFLKKKSHNIIYIYIISIRGLLKEVIKEGLIIK